MNTSTAIRDQEALTSLLDIGCKALNLVLTVGQQRSLLDYLAQINKWNATFNLTAIRQPREQLVAHLLDSLAIVPVLAPHLTSGATVLDVGSGGGLPGIVLAIVAPHVNVHCVDAVGKKAAFITQMRGTLGLPQLHAHHARVETLRVDRDLPAPTLIVARAFASLVDLVALTDAVLAPDGLWAAMKGRRPDDEIAALPPSIRVAAVDQLHVPGLDAERHLVRLVRATSPSLTSDS